MRVRAGRVIVLLCIGVVAILGLGVAQVLDATAPDRSREDAGDVATRPAMRAARARIAGGAGSADAAGTGDAATAAHRAARAPRVRAAAADAVVDADAATVVASPVKVAAPPSDAAVAAAGPQDDRIGAKTAPAAKLSGAAGAGGLGAPSPRTYSAPPKPGTLTIVVRAAETGAPLDEAEVTIIVGESRPDVVRPDALGRVVWPLDPESTADVRVKFPGRVIARRADLTVQPGKDTPVAFNLVRGVVVRGLVTRGQGIPVAGARVRAWTEKDWRSVMPLEDERFPLGDVVTDAAGRYVIDVVPRATRTVLVAEAARQATRGHVLEPEPDPDYVVRCDIALKPGATFSGRVVDGSGGGSGPPVAGARVLAHMPVDVAEVRRSKYWRLKDLSDAQIVEHAVLDDIDGVARGWSYGLLRACRAVTDAEGRFAIAGCPADTKLRLVAFAAGLGRSAPSDEVAAGDRPTLALRGRVAVQFDVRTPMGEPASEVEVERFWSWETWAAARLGKGVVGTPVLDVGVHRIQMSGKGLAQNHYACDVQPVAGGPSVTAVRLRAGFTVSGVVVDDLGAPLATAKVGGETRLVDCARDGSFTHDGLDPRWNRYLGAEAPGHLDGWTKLERRDQSGVRIVLRRVAVVTARLRPADGTSVPPWRRIVVSGPPWSGGAGNWERRPDELAWDGGSVRVGGLGAGTSEIAFIVPGMMVVVREARTDVGGTTDLGDVVLVPARRVDGVVQDESGAPVPGAEVVLAVTGVKNTRDARTSAAIWSHVPRRVAITGAYGRFVLDITLEELTFAAEARASAGLRGSTAIAAQVSPAEPSLPLVVVVSSATVRSGRIAGLTSGKGFTAVWSGASRSQRAECPVAADGTFEALVPGVPERVFVWAQDPYRSGEATIDPAADPAVPVVVHLR